MQQSSQNPIMQSYRDHIRYPRNLIPGLTKAYRWELEQYGNKLADLRSSLCLESEEKVDLPIRDIYSTLERGDGKFDTISLIRHDRLKVVRITGVQYQDATGATETFRE